METKNRATVLAEKSHSADRRDPADEPLQSYGAGTWPIDRKLCVCVCVLDLFTYRGPFVVLAPGEYL